MLTTAECSGVVQFWFQRKVLGYCLGQVKAFLVDGLLIDTGPSILGREMLDTCRGYHLEQIVNTHHHEEHIGNNAVLQREFSLPIRAHREALPVIRQPQENLRLSLYQRFVWGQPVMAKARRIGNQIVTQQYSFRIIPTPGHSPDHICLYEEKQGWLFAGDLFGDNQTSRDNQFYPADNKADLYNSLTKIAQLDLSLIFSASLGMITDPNQLINRQLGFWKSRLERTN